MDDTISRKWLMECVNEGWIKFDTEKDENRFIHLVRDIAPSVQPGKRTDKRTETHACDSISRAAVVDAIEGVDWYHQNQHGEMVHGANPDDHQAWYKAEDIYKAVESVPPAQSEPLTDKEQRIFLAAMEREENVCKKVDEECRYCREPYEDSLVNICHEIIRKVKGALWT